MKIYIFCGGPSNEYEISLKSAEAILKAIDYTDYTAYVFHIGETAAQSPANTNTQNTYQDQTQQDHTYSVHITEASQDLNIKTFVRNNPPTHKTLAEGFKDVAVNSGIALLAAMHGEFGEDGTIQSLLEDASIRYTGSDAESSKLSWDKYASGEKVKSIPGIQIPYTERVSEQTKQSYTRYPAVIKPNTGGSSQNISIIQSAEEIDLEKHTGYLIQEKINGIEASCGVLQNKDGSFKDIPPIEIIPTRSEFFDYDAKYVPGYAQEITPPQHLSADVSSKLVRFSQEIHSMFGCSIYSRSDFIVTKNSSIYFLEINTLPGLTSNSLLPKEAAEQGMSLENLIDYIIRQSI